MKFVFVLLLLFLFTSFIFSQKTKGGFSKVIYDTDDRLDTFELDTFDIALGRSSILLIEGFDVLTENEDGSFSATSTETAEQFWNYCPDERYSGQLILSQGQGFCSAFLIASNWIGTAAHCSLSEPSEYIVIFGFELTTHDHTHIHFTADEVYTVSEIIAVGEPTGTRNDYGILQLDRDVVGFNPYTKINHNVKIGDDLILIGYPTGLPKKTDKGGKVTFSGEQSIRGTVDSYGGNSGSPVFDSNGLLVGILVGGSNDFVISNRCEVSNVCPDGIGCEDLGEYIIPICVLIASSEEVQDRLQISCKGTEESDEEFTYSEIPVLSNSLQLLPCIYLLLFISLLI